VVNCSGLDMLVREKCSYSKNEVFEYAPWGCILQTSFSSKLTKRPNKLVLNYNRLDILVREKHSTLLDPFVSYSKCCEHAPLGWIHNTSLSFVTYEWSQ
jgi:hypothetical protein